MIRREIGTRVWRWNRLPCCSLSGDEEFATSIDLDTQKEEEAVDPDSSSSLPMKFPAKTTIRLLLLLLFNWRRSLLNQLVIVVK